MSVYQFAGCPSCGWRHARAWGGRPVAAPTLPATPCNTRDPTAILTPVAPKPFVLRLALGARLTAAGAAKIIDQVATWNANNPEHVNKAGAASSQADAQGAAGSSGERMVLPDGLVKPTVWKLAVPPKGKNT